ncbi:MAG: penicillin-binding protein 2 [Spirochaetales bacterium]|nr:penicillin-binding protein 2 [Spirochaetales bacterium]
MAIETSHLNRRIIALLIITLFFFILFTARLFSVQIVRGALREVSNKNHELYRSERIHPLRGRIYASDSKIPLAFNSETFSVFVIPALVPKDKLDEIFALTESILELEKDYIMTTISGSRLHMYTRVLIASNVTLEKIIELGENKNILSGVVWQNIPQRQALELRSLAHIVGYIGPISPNEFKIRSGLNYSKDDLVGKLGVEKEYDTILKGSYGQEITMRDAKNKIVENTSSIIPPVNGNDIVLTIDTRIQELCEKALGERTGSIIVMKPTTGEILAMVSYPYYEPNKIYEDNNNITKYNTNQQKPFFNRALMSSYSPASTFKVVMTTAILEEKVLPTNQTVRCTGSLRVGDRYFHCHQRRGHGYMDLKNALAESCNVYYYTAGLKMGPEIIANYARKYGYGSSTKVDLPGESSLLIVPDANYKYRNFNQETWFDGDTANLSIGQGYLMVTTLQMANMMAMIVNEGKVYKPHFLKEIRDQDTGETIKTYEKEILHTLDLKKENWKLLKQALRYSVTDGTSSTVFMRNSVKVAGKTGTGQVGRDGHLNACFVAYGPYDAEIEDQFVVVTMVDSDNDWEWWAVKAASIVFHGINKDLDFVNSVKDLRAQWWFKQDERKQFF